MHTTNTVQSQRLTTHPHLETVLSAFPLEGSIQHIQPLGNGHIHDTYLITTCPDHQANYVLQRINTHIFGDPQALMQNIYHVTRHIQHKLSIRRVSHWRALTLVLTHAQKLFHADENRECWRLYHHIDGNAIDTISTPKQATEAGRAFGEFLDFLSDLDVSLISETLPQFHCLQHRTIQFEEALLQNLKHRAHEATEEIAFVRGKLPALQPIQNLGKAGKLPLRITHNDTKLNNVLFNAQQEALCVLDLDTVMPGYLYYDYSDAVRILANTALEDEKNLSRVNFHLNRYRLFCEAFIQAVHLNLTNIELTTLADSTPLLPFTIGLRFLTDYLNGDIYFKTHYPEHNLVRARCQFALAKAIDAQLPAIRYIVEQSYALTKKSSAIRNHSECLP